MKALRYLVFGPPFVGLFVVGLLVAIADDLLCWDWVHELDLWLMQWAEDLQEQLCRKR